MNVLIGNSDTRETILDYCGRTYKINLQEFARVLGQFPQFSQVQLDTSWGLLILTWHRKGQRATTSVFLDILQLTDGMVIDDDTGVLVHRWQRLADQLVKDAETKAVPDGLYLPPGYRPHV